MDGWTVIAGLALGLSTSVSALQIGRWLLNAKPRAIVDAGRWTLVGLALLSVVMLLSLVVSGRWTLAAMLAAFATSVLVHAAPRWRVLLDRLRIHDHGIPPNALDPTEGARPDHRAPAPSLIDPELVQRSAAVLQAYLQQAKHQVEDGPNGRHLRRGLTTERCNGSGQDRMTTEEALDVLGLEPAASVDEIRRAHRRLEEKLDPDAGGTRYLAGKVNIAKDVLLGDRAVDVRGDRCLSARGTDPGV